MTNVPSEGTRVTVLLLVAKTIQKLAYSILGKHKGEKALPWLHFYLDTPVGL
jgi:hypothetical protein